MASSQENISTRGPETFPDEHACCAYLIHRRWPQGVCCPRCGSNRVHPSAPGQTRWNCLNCGKGGPYRFSHLAGTLFENTKIPLSSWFRVVRLLMRQPEISVLQARDAMGLRSYKTAWYMLQRLRLALRDEEFCRMLGIGEGPFTQFMSSGVTARTETGRSPVDYANP